MSKYWGKLFTIGFILAYLIASIGPQSLGSAENPSASSVLVTEFLAGVAGASVGGMAGGLAIKSIPPTSEENAGFLNLAGLGLGVSLGTTAGVALAGYLHGVKGNILLTFAGSTVGLVESLVITSVLKLNLQELKWWQKMALFTVPPAFMATLGYNVGADRGEGDKASPTKGASKLEAPLFQLNF